MARRISTSASSSPAPFPRKSAGAHDQIESLSYTETVNAALTCDAIGQFAKVCGGVDAAHAATVQAQAAEWP
jgi:hypothetical protein